MDCGGNAPGHFFQDGGSQSIKRYFRRTTHAWIRGPNPDQGQGEGRRVVERLDPGCVLVWEDAWERDRGRERERKRGGGRP